MKQSPIPLDCLIELASPSDPQISPDGKWIAYTVFKPDWKENQFVGQLYLIENKPNAEPRQLTFSKHGSSIPRWTSDSQHLTFLSKRDDDEGSQIYRLSILGGEAERLTKLKSGIRNMKHAPDGKSIAFWAVPPQTPQQKEREEKYGTYVEDNVDFERCQLWLLEIESKKVQQLTVGDKFHVLDCQWHPAGDKIAVTAMPSSDMGDRLRTRIYVLDVTSLEVRPLGPLRSSSPHWSPDGTSLAYQRGEYKEEEGAFYKNARLEIISLDNEKIRSLGTDFDEDIHPIAWSNDGIYFWALQRTSCHLFRVVPESGELQQVSPHDLDGMVAREYSFDANCTRCATVLADSDTFWEVGTMDLPRGDLKRLSTYNKATESWDLPRHEVYAWKSGDGTEIEGVLTKPVNFDSDTRYPLLVIIHGGPTSVSQRTHCGLSLYPIYQWVHQGAIVLQPNYRGSAGYGEAFRSLNVRDLGTGDYADVISGVDALINEGWVDPDRVGAMGWSQGGFISAFIACYSDRFKAVSVGAGISNWTTYYVNTDIHPFTRIYLKETPWNDPEIYARTSPITYIANARTPTLIQHGEDDARVPLPNAYELHQGLLDHGVESKLVVYPGMPHGPTKPKQVRHIMNDNFRWFNRHIFDMQEDDDEAPALYIVFPSQEENNSLVTDVLNLARRDEARYRVFNADGKLLDSHSTAPGQLSIEDISVIVNEIAREFDELDVKQVILYSEKLDEKPHILIAMGCIQIAAGIVGHITVEHRQIDV